MKLYLLYIFITNLIYINYLKMSLDMKFANKFGWAFSTEEDLTCVPCVAYMAPPDNECPVLKNILDSIWKRHYRAQHSLKFRSVLKDVKETRLCYCGTFFRVNHKRVLSHFCDFCADYELSEYARSDDPDMAKAGRF